MKKRVLMTLNLKKSAERRGDLAAFRICSCDTLSAAVLAVYSSDMDGGALRSAGGGADNFWDKS
ncbi:MAG TPA: hypothetical protein VK805_12615, partial [Candidatus Baltobacteraceae bacterium]|nr:hypothetical protein [Candidatus Baltobacteraceae bacterium]